MLNNLFIFTDNSSKKSSNKIFLKNVNKYYYICLFLAYSLFKNTINFLQNFISNTFGAKVQTNRLPFRSIPNSVKQFLIFVVLSESWDSFFKRVKNTNNIFILREKRNAIAHRFWCIFHRSRIINFLELNINCKFQNKTSNIYYLFTDVNSNRKLFNPIIFYYFNKLIILSQPYFYWTYIHLYNKYENSLKAVKKSRNAKEVFFFLLVNSIKSFFNQKNNQSFVKLSLKTFKGVRTVLKNLENVSNIELIKSKKLLQDSELEQTSEKENLFERNFLKKYDSNFKSNVLNLKFYINNIIQNNVTLFTKRTNNNIKNLTNFLKITWYNKVHNSIIDVKKSNIILYLRAARHFNKGRYSRNRQLYRTGVYWCIWLNVVIVYALHYYFYRVVFSFGYLWLPLGLMTLVMFSSRLYKYRFYDVDNLIQEFKEFNNFVYYQSLYIRNNYLQKKSQFINFFINFFKNYFNLFMKFLKIS